VLEFFGISLPVLRVAGGVVIAMAGWNLLNSGDEGPDQTMVDSVNAPEASRIAVYPLTMPITTGPGTISVAVALGNNRPDKVASLAVFLLAATLVTAVLSLMIYLWTVPQLGSRFAGSGADRHRHHRALVLVPAVLHRHPGAVERRFGVDRQRDQTVTRENEKF
jgi:multiple antibiotic resistance protein